MRFIFKTRYEQDIELVQHGGQVFWYGLLMAVLLVAPMLVSPYVLTQLSQVCIYAIVALGLMLLAGFTGQLSLGHAAFMAVGAYTVAVLEQRTGLPVLSCLIAAGVVAAATGILVGLPSLRIKGLYLGIATLAASVILNFVFLNWASVTNGPRGINVPTASVFGMEMAEPGQLYALVLPITVVMVLMAKNLFRTRVGRAFVAIRDRDISAEVIGIQLFRYKLMSFAISSFYAGVAGGLWAYLFRVVTPESFPLTTSIFFLAAVIVGGLGWILGGILGAIFMTLVPEVLKLIAAGITPWFPDAPIYLGAVRAIIFGMLIVGFLIFEPNGLAEMWRRTRRFFALWPFRT